MHGWIRTSLIVFCVFFLLNARTQNQSKADSILRVIGNRDLNTDEELVAYSLLATYSTSPEDELKYGQELLGLAKRAKNLEFQIRAYLRIGVAYRLRGDLSKALEYLFEGADIASDKEQFKSALANIYSEIGTCYSLNNDNENALNYSSKSIQILRSTDEQITLALTLLNTGYDYYLVGNYDSAMTYYNESELILEENGRALGLAYLIGNRALVFWKTGNITRSKKDLFKAIEMLEPFEDHYAIADYYNQLGNVFFEQGDSDQAILYTEKGLSLAKTQGLKDQIRNASNLLFRIYRSLADYEKAIDYQTQYYAYKDSIQNLETTQRLANLRTEYEIGQKQSEVDLLVEQKRNTQIILITGAIILLIVICLVIIIYSSSKAKMRLNRSLEEQKDSLIKANQTKDKFFSIISHDLRGPVNMMSGLISVTKYFIEDKKTDQLREMMDKMEDSVDRLVKLLDNLLHWALQQRGHFPYIPESLNLNIILFEVVDMFKDMAASKNITIQSNVEEDFLLYADRNMTSTILRNLLNNAIKFTPNGGQITVSAERKAKVGVIHITDNGVGMPREKLQRLFKLNENLSTQGTSGEAGLGLGLQLVYEFVQLNKGEIGVESKEGQGTTFKVHLPLAS